MPSNRPSVDLTERPYDSQIGPRLECRVLHLTQQVNQRRYEALRAFFVDGLTHTEVAERFGYTRWAMVALVRDYRVGKLSTYEISARR